MPPGQRQWFGLKDDTVVNKTLQFLVLLIATMLPTWSAIAQAQEPAPRIVNLINFIRGVEPRGPVDLVEPVREQIRLGKKWGLPTTFLIQYDAMLRPEIVNLLKSELGPDDEIGVWLEVVQPQVEAVGLGWKGRFPWDWHTNVGFTIGYTPEQRRLLMDELMRKFKEVFGKLPTSAGCWIIDAPTLNYIVDEYGIEAVCICKDQIGTDGYNLWGGYWSGAYYPSRKNAYMSAQTAEQQLNVPVFKMLGSDPIYQYDTGLGHTIQGVTSLEPVYGDSGGDPAWVRWFFDVYFDAPCLAYSYAQAGQENSFGWEAMGPGLNFQYAYLAGARRDGRVRVETLAESAAWFRERFKITPATAVVADKDWKGNDRRSVWYQCANYRVSFVAEGDRFRIRDIHLFDENYPGRYNDRRVETHHARFDTLPVIDGFNWSNPDGVIAGIRLVEKTVNGYKPLATGDFSVEEQARDVLVISMPVRSGGSLTITCTPQGIKYQVEGSESSRRRLALEMTWDPTKPSAVKGVEGRTIRYKHNGYAYGMRVAGAIRITQPIDTGIVIQLRDNAVELRFDH